MSAIILAALPGTRGHVCRCCWWRRELGSSKQQPRELVLESALVFLLLWDNNRREKNQVYLVQFHWSRKKLALAFYHKMLGEKWLQSIFANIYLDNLFSELVHYFQSVCKPFQDSWHFSLPEKNKVHLFGRIFPECLGIRILKNSYLFLFFMTFTLYFYVCCLDNSECETVQVKSLCCLQSEGCSNGITQEMSCSVEVSLAWTQLEVKSSRLKEFVWTHLITKPAAQGTADTWSNTAPNQGAAGWTKGRKTG